MGLPPKAPRPPGKPPGADVAPGPLSRSCGPDPVAGCTCAGCGALGGRLAGGASDGLRGVGASWPRPWHRRPCASRRPSLAPRPPVVADPATCHPSPRGGSPLRARMASVLLWVLNVRARIAASCGSPGRGARTDSSVGPRCGAEARQVTGSHAAHTGAGAQRSPEGHSVSTGFTHQARQAGRAGHPRAPGGASGRHAAPPGAQQTQGLPRGTGRSQRAHSWASGRTAQVWRSGCGDAALNAVRKGDKEWRAHPRCACLSCLALGSPRAPCRWPRGGQDIWPATRERRPLAAAG